MKDIARIPRQIGLPCLNIHAIDPLEATELYVLNSITTIAIVSQ